ncbi:MAG: FliA/WhiG family RNA polymerase sigma factor [Deltaproteobacteria bacterium]|nr:FliA/WhiG family RNA polymerase sigma factor [Deltaproteobacteria bacterium]
MSEASRAVDDTTRAELIHQYTPLIKLVAMRILRRLPPQIELDDLINTGVLGLMDAIDKFDPSRDIKFATYAEYRIRGAILDELRSLDWVPRSIRQRLNDLERAMEEMAARHGRPGTDDELAAHMGVTHEELFEMYDQANGVTLVSYDDLAAKKGQGAVQRKVQDYFREPHEQDIISLLNLRQVKNLVAEAIDELPKNERFVVSMYYFDELTMKEIGLVLGITESRVSQIHNKAVLRLRGKLKRHLEDAS